MNLIGNKVMLREIKESDMNLFNKLINSSNVEQFVVGWSKPVTMGEQNAWFQGLKNDNNIRYSIVNVNDSELYGTLIISKIDWKNRTCGLDIKLSDESRGKGIGTESVTLAVDYIFEQLNLNRVEVKILDYNVASQRIFEKLGFVKEGILRDSIFKNGKYNDLFVYGLLKKDYLNERNR